MCMRKLIAGGLLTVAAASAVLLCAASAGAGVLYANPAVTGAGDCSSRVDAWRLQTALTGATAGDEIQAMAGTHRPGPNREDTFQLVGGGPSDGWANARHVPPVEDGE